MKKLFFFIPALLLSLVTNAATVNVSPGTNALRSAYNSAEAGSTLVLGAGTYDETERIEFTKSMTIKAADGAEVIVKPRKDNYIKTGANVKFIGIKFDESEMTTYQYFIRSYDNTTGKELHFENCEFANFTTGENVKYLIYAANSSDKRQLDSCVINNCIIHDINGYIVYLYKTATEDIPTCKGVVINNSYCHDVTKSAIYVEKSTVSGTETCNSIIVKNSTFANFTALDYPLIGVFNYGETKASNIELKVDHCTFYNFMKTAESTYSAIDSRKSQNVTISNCIFAQPTSQSFKSTYCYGGTISNCLSYNTTGHRTDDITPTNCLNNIDPLFTNAAAGNLTLSAGSPALFAATDNSHLGDPRWWPAVPSTDFSSPCVFTGAAATISGNIWKTDDANQYLYGDGGHNQYYGTAQWEVHANRACYLEVTLNIGSENAGSGHQFKVEVFDSENNLVGAAMVEPSESYANTNVTLPGILYLPEAADYRVKLSNLTEWSSAYIRGITFSYAGGGTVEVPANALAVNDALFSANGTRADGVISFEDAATGWAKWNISVTAGAFYEIALTIKNQYGHNMTVALYEEDGETLVGQVTEGATVYDENPDGHTYNLGGMYLNADNYVVKVTNATSGSDAKIASVAFTHTGGAVQNMPGTTAINEAWFSSNGTRADSKITFPGSTIQDGWVKWNVAFAGSATYNVTINVNTTTGHSYTVALYRSEEDDDPITVSNIGDYDHKGSPVALDLGSMDVAAGNYILKVTNGLQYSDAALLSVKFAYAGGGTVDIPGTIPLADATFSSRAYLDGSGYLHFTDNDHVGTISGEWAKWNIHAEDGVYTFTAHGCSPSDYSNFTFIVYDDQENELYTYTPAYTYKSDDKAITTPEWMLAEGDYTLKLSNPANHSHGYLLSLSAAAVDNVVVLDEEATDNSVIVANNGSSKRAALKRSFRAGMYNTICLPINVSSTSELTRIFGDGYELLEFTEGTVDGAVLSLEFATPASGIHHGNPYLIKPTKDVLNPVFSSHTISKETSYNTVSGTNANFIGSFIQTSLAADPNNLFLGANDMLYFPSSAKTIKGMRAWFVLHDVPAGVVGRARIVQGTNTITEIEFINGEWREADKIGKAIENGQLIIIRDGVRYNALGQCLGK